MVGLPVQVSKIRLQSLYRTSQIRRSEDGLAIENAESFLQRCDLFLATGDTFLVSLAGIQARWLKLLVVLEGGVQFLLCSIEVGLGLLRACSSFCFLPDLLSMSLDFASLSAEESDMNSSYSFLPSASAVLVSDSRRAKSDWMTSIMPTTPPLSPPMPLYGSSGISGCFSCINAVASPALA